MGSADTVTSGARDELSCIPGEQSSAAGCRGRQRPPLAAMNTGGKAEGGSVFTTEAGGGN